MHCCLAVRRVLALHCVVSAALVRGGLRLSVALRYILVFVLAWHCRVVSASFSVALCLSVALRSILSVV